MRLNYVSPKIEVVEVIIEDSILAGSFTASGEDFDGGIFVGDEF